MSDGQPGTTMSVLDGSDAGARPLGPAERAASGKAAREKAPLEAHAEFRPAQSRNPVGLLLGQAKTRVPDLDRRPGVDGQPPDPGAQPVGADDQVELAAAAVVEADLDGPVEVLQRPDGRAHPYRHALPQDLVQVGSGQG